MAAGRLELAAEGVFLPFGAENEGSGSNTRLSRTRPTPDR
jgi:hypothetical protein